MNKRRCWVSSSFQYNRMAIYDNEMNFFSLYLLLNVVDAMLKWEYLSCLFVRLVFVTNRLGEGNYSILEVKLLDYYEDDFVEYNWIEWDLMLLMLMMDLFVWEGNHWIMVVNYLNLNYMRLNQIKLCCLLLVVAYRKVYLSLRLLLRMTRRKMMVTDYQETKNLVDVDLMYLLITLYHWIIMNFASWNWYYLIY